MNVLVINRNCIGYLVILMNAKHIAIQGKLIVNLGHFQTWNGTLLFLFWYLHTTLSIFTSTFFIFIGIIWRPHKHTRIYFVAQMHFRMWLSCIINFNIIYKYISSQKEVNKLSVILNEMARPRFHFWYLAASASVFVVIFRYIFIMHLKHQYHLTKHIWKDIKFLLWNQTYKKYFTGSRSNYIL